MNQHFSRRLFTVTLCCAGASVDARSARCDVCGSRMPRQSWTYDGRTCCSEACVDALRPKCSICGKIIRGEYRTLDEKVFCGDDCFRTTLPKCKICKAPIEKGFTVTQYTYCERCMEKTPTCFSCGLPAAYPTHLDDGREICVGCMRWAVKDQVMAQRNYERARRQLEAWTSLKHASVPELVLVDKNEMQQLSKKLRKSDSPVSIRGLYSRQTMMTKQGLFGAWKEAPELDQEKIYIVDHLHDSVFRVAATHELMHDLIHEHFPRLKDAPLWVHEGICQQAAAELCRRRNYVDTLDGIEKCLDTDYGDGFRYIKKVSGFQGWRALRQWMDTVDVETLPKIAPK